MKHCTKIALIIFCLVLVAPVAFAQKAPLPPADLKEAVKHLEYLGYKVESVSEQGSIRLVHDDELNIAIMRYNGGILFNAWFDTTEKAHEDEAGFCAFINEINADSTVIKYYLDLSDYSFALEAWYPGNYDRSSFTQFMKMWMDDWKRHNNDYDAEFNEYIA